MKGLFLNQLQKAENEQYNKLIIFFNGWSLDENIVNHLTSYEYDVLMFYDYANLEISKETINEINNYKEINIIAWSFGVWACGNVIDKFKNLKEVIAINGTLIPIDNKFGISEKMFNLTLSNLSEKTYPKFFQNMFEGDTNFEKLPKRDIENQKQELINIRDNSSLKPYTKFFTKVFVGNQDKIISAKNQINFWGEDFIVRVNKGHYIFDLFKSWDEIICK